MKSHLDEIVEKMAPKQYSKFMQESNILEWTEAIWRIMNKENISIKDLAKKLKMSQNKLKRIIGDSVSSEITFQDMSNIMTALNVKWEITLKWNKFHNHC